MSLAMAMEEHKAAVDPQDVEQVITAIERAALISEMLMREAADEHRYAFRVQMWEKVGAGDVALEEPYLETELARFRLQFLKTLKRLLDQLERKVAKKLPRRKDWESIGTKSGDFASLERVSCDLQEANHENIHTDFEFKAIDPGKPVAPQVEERIAIESVRVKRRFKQALDEKRQRAFGLKRYIWRSQDDRKVRASHRANDDRIFEWGTPPSTGHPGEDYGCRCWAEPLLDGAGDAETPAAGEIEVAALGFALREIIKRLATTATRVRGRVPKPKPKIPASKPKTPKKPPTSKIFNRPKGVPKSWIRKPTKDGRGVVYEKPGSRGSTYVKIKKGKPSSTNPGQQVDNVRWQRNGQSLDRNGSPVPRKSEKSHIPIDDFVFKLELFR